MLWSFFRFYPAMFPKISFMQLEYSMKAFRFCPNEFLKTYSIRVFCNLFILGIVLITVQNNMCCIVVSIHYDPSLAFATFLQNNFFIFLNSFSAISLFSCQVIESYLILIFANSGYQKKFSLHRSLCKQSLDLVRTYGGPAWVFRLSSHCASYN